MSKDDDQGGPADTGEVVDRRQASLLLSGLVLTPDSSLDVYRERRAADGDLDLELLRHARDILDQVSLAISTAEPERWDRVERAWKVLCDSPAHDETGPVTAAVPTTRAVRPSPATSAVAPAPVPAVVPSPAATP
ncbi:MAG: hypothetical protein JRI23_03655, partial [Deltaproteobacteria bacterium]|nr:hypothetical protein [Deltaproteobacteria bacterium]MBW2530612.1 hypothetical protein [Deltaproteobacteria bacterium]